MARGKTESKGVSEDLVQYTDAMKVSMDYCQPKWESYLRFYKLWSGDKPPELDATISQIWVNIFHATVQNRFPQIFENVFSQPDYLSLKADDPRFQLSVGPAQTWLRDLLEDKIRIRNSAIETVQSALIGGNGFRMPYAHYRAGKPIITSRDLSYFNVLPSPNGSQINPSDYDTDDGLDWMFVIDWWTEDKIKALGTRSGFNKEQIGKLLDKRDGSEQYEEDTYKNQFKTINGLDYDGLADEYEKISNVPSSMRKRRLVHWFRRDQHIIVAEDAYVIYKGKPPMGEGIIPVVNYCVTPNPKNFYGISQIELVEDLVMAMVMNFNYRMDHLLGVMFPTTWIRDDLFRGKTEDDFIPRPYSVNKFPVSVSDIGQAMHYDRRPEVTQQTFLDEAAMKAFLQNVSGEMETTGSYGDVVGNRSATGVTTIANQLKARPNMEAAILEEKGFRMEATLLLKLGAMHVNDPVMINTPATEFATAWTEISPLDITDKFSVRMHGARHAVDENARFQRTMALYPFWNGNPGVNQFELNKQVNELGDVLPEPEKVFVPPPAPSPEVSNVRPSNLPAEPGGIAAAQGGANTQRSIQNREQVQPGGGTRPEAF